jgi:hypothetical protein
VWLEKTTTTRKQKAKHVAGASKSKAYEFYDEYKILF